MPLFNREQWEKAQKEKKLKRNLHNRQRLLMQKLRRGISKFREDPKLQTELRRVAALCVKLDVHLNSTLQEEIARGVMES